MDLQLYGELIKDCFKPKSSYRREAGLPVFFRAIEGYKQVFDATQFNL